VEAGRLPALPVLRELTDTLPAGAWLQSLTMDRQGVELTGQAGGASTLTPPPEASPRLERAEFPSPVTKTQNKEQFRIRAAWEASADSNGARGHGPPQRARADDRRDGGGRGDPRRGLSRPGGAA